MNTKLSLLLGFLIVCVCGCELGTDRVYMEMYEAMNANSTTIESSLKSKIETMEQAVKRKPDYKGLVPAAKEIDKSVSDFIKFVEHIDRRIDNRDMKVINDDETKGNIIRHRHKIIEILKGLSGNRTLAIREAEIQNLIDLHFFPNGTLPPISGKPFEDYSFENQSIASNKAIFAKQKNDALILAKVAVDYLGSKIGTTRFGCFGGPVVVSSPKKNFVIKGETFETEIFIYYPHTTHHSKVEMIIKVDDKEIPSKNGVATYKTTPSVYGEHKYVVIISIKNPFNNRFETYRRTFSFEVGERCY